MLLAKTFRKEHIDAAASELGSGVAEHFFHFRIEQGYQAVLIGYQNAVGSRFEQHPKLLADSAFPRLRLVAFGRALRNEIARQHQRVAELLRLLDIHGRDHDRR